MKTPFGLCGVLAWAFLVTIAGCVPGVSVTGSGQVKSEPRQVGHFTAVEVAGSGKLIVQQTGTDSLEVEAEDNLLPLLTSEVHGDRLVLGTRDNANLHPTRPIVYHVTVKDLTGLSVSGSADIKATDIDTPRLKVEISGSGSADISGKAQSQELDISGSGHYSAADLDSTDAKIGITGSGSAVVKVSGKLDANISGSGSVEYIGSPATSLHVSGSGSIHQRAK